ncbi:DUF1292 domain-containing protein [Desulfofalx alkaliphila]|uniref:DUF1292 domain-containing protein n=1 Tax=Desulfofalx alkaliphila TaxID=105483 RepID=UPI0004E181B9|nr:DUF1292 domain-containing protein [Desulfofalx alkaliphila]
MPEHDEVITLVDEEGQEHDFTVVDILEINGSEYAILLPAKEETDEAVILKFAKDEDDNDILIDLEDDEEWEMVADAWEQLVTEEGEDA